MKDTKPYDKRSFNAGFKAGKKKNDEFLRFISWELPDVYKKLRKEYNARKASGCLPPEFYRKP